jgi:hypothetical protein
MGEGEGRLHLSQTRLLRCHLQGVREQLSLKAKSRRDKLFEAFLEK